MDERYGKLVKSHMNCTTALAAGAKALPDGVQAFAHTQAQWRFLANERVTPQGLSGPLLAATRDAVKADGEEYVLSIADWSRVNYGGHVSKRDRLQMTHATDIGYELQSSVLVSAQDGAPLGVPAQNLVTAQGVWRSRDDAICAQVPSHLDELSERMTWLEQQTLGPRRVHMVDREADSVAHLRRWTQNDQLWLVRLKGGSTVHYGGSSMRIDAVAHRLDFTQERKVLCKGRPVRQWIASATVILTRAARPKKADAGGRRASVPGEPLAARLVVSRLYAAAGQMVAEWFLLTSVPDTVSAARIALWYYFRWQIESFFKLLKQAGHHLEQWEQESGSATFKRLLIATQACVLVWRLARQEGASSRNPPVPGSTVRSANEGRASRHPFRFARRNLHAVRHPRYPRPLLHPGSSCLRQLDPARPEGVGECVDTHALKGREHPSCDYSVVLADNQGCGTAGW